MSWSRVLRRCLCDRETEFELIEHLFLILFYIVYFRSSEWHNSSPTQSCERLDAFGGISHKITRDFTKIAPICVCLGESCAQGKDIRICSANPDQASNQYMGSVETIATYSANDFSVDGNLRRRSGSTRSGLSSITIRRRRSTRRSGRALRQLERPISLPRVLRHYQSLNVYEGEIFSKALGTLESRRCGVFVNPQPERVRTTMIRIAPNNQWIDLEIEKTKRRSMTLRGIQFEHATKIDEKITCG